MDVLTDVLNTLQMESALYCRAELRPPWSLAFAPTRVATFHAVDRGRCWLQIDGAAAPIALSPGDLVMLPRGDGHLVSDEPGRPGYVTIRLDEDVPAACQVITSDGGGPYTTLLCGLFDIGRWDGHPLTAMLPQLIHLRGDQGHAAPWLDATLRFLAAEAGSSRPGAETIVRRLVDVLFVQVIRAWVEGEGGQARGWLSALRDAQVAAALGSIHSHPERRWTVEGLASAAMMSRSAFAARFSALVGVPPLQYLTAWRMRVAAQLLRGGHGLQEVAGRVGYESEVAFQRAFKRELGVPPGAYRQAAGAVPPRIRTGDVSARGGLQ